MPFPGLSGWIWGKTWGSTKPIEPPLDLPQVWTLSQFFKLLSHKSGSKPQSESASYLDRKRSYTTWTTKYKNP